LAELREARWDAACESFEESLAGDALAALDRDFTEYTEHADRGPAGGPAEYHYEYLLVVGRTLA
jgi:hypothetical protein